MRHILSLLACHRVSCRKGADSGHRCGSRLRHAECSRFHFRQPPGTPGFGHRRVPADPQEGGPRPRHAGARRPHGRAGRGHAQGRGAGGRARRADRGHRARYHRLERRARSANLEPLDDYYLWCDHRAAREAAEITAAGRRENLAALEWCGGVYSSEWGFSKLLHWLRNNPAQRARFATALEHCDMVAAVLCGITDPLAGPAQRLRHGPQVDVERIPRRTAAGGVPGRGRSAARRRAREARRPLRHLRPDRRPPRPRLGGATRPQARHPHPRRRLRRALGRHRRRRARRRRRQRGRHLHLHHGHRQAGGPHPRRLRRGQGLHPPAVLRHRSRPFGHRRYLRRHRPPRRHQRRRAFKRPRRTTAPARPACCASPGTTATAPCS